MHEKPRAELRGGENVFGYGCNGMVRAREPIGPAAFVIVTTMAAACGCTTSALIRPDDPVFARATTRMERTITEVEATGGASAERSLFLQAEAFYRYRFEPPRRGGTSFLAEAAAAITDFPALQSLAGSLDLVDLRLRSADGAVQLWETLLQRYPNSPLRPLTLYRLGWAYRNVGAAGLPRESGDEAFKELLRAGTPAPIAAILPAARATPSKSKGTAARWSLIPGLGQFYVGEPVNGSVRLAMALAATAAIVTPAVIGFERGSDLTFKHDWPLLARGLVVLSIDYTPTRTRCAASSSGMSVRRRSSKTPTRMPPDGSHARWDQLFRALGSSLAGGSGWAILDWDAYLFGPATTPTRWHAARRCR